MKALVEGPITGGTRGRPFAASTLDFEKLGYEEEEYLLSGTAAGSAAVADCRVLSRLARVCSRAD